VRACVSEYLGRGGSFFSLGGVAFVLNHRRDAHLQCTLLVCEGRQRRERAPSTMKARGTLILGSFLDCLAVVTGNSSVVTVGRSWSLTSTSSERLTIVWPSLVVLPSAWRLSVKAMVLSSSLPCLLSRVMVALSEKLFLSLSPSAVTLSSHDTWPLRSHMLLVVLPWFSFLLPRRHDTNSRLLAYATGRPLASSTEIVKRIATLSESGRRAIRPTMLPRRVRRDLGLDLEEDVLDDKAGVEAETFGVRRSEKLRWSSFHSEKPSTWARGLFGPWSSSSPNGSAS